MVVVSCRVTMVVVPYNVIMVVMSVKHCDASYAL